jgi:rhamnose transport system substrate-binding protein
MISSTRRLVVGLAAIALVVGACGSSATPSPVPPTAAPTTAPESSAPASMAPESSAPAMSSMTATMIPKQINNPYFDVAYKGAQKAATDLGGSVTQVGPSAADATQQVPFIQTAATQGNDAILISADDATAVAPARQDAM